MVKKMKLRLVYGRAGTGKTELCFQEIVKKEANQEKIYLITPEQFSFTTETKLLQSLSKRAVFQVEVISFQRMAYRILNEVGGRTKTALTSCGKFMLLYDILKQAKGDLKFLDKREENIDMIHQMITELKRHQITIETLKKQQVEQTDPSLKLKLKDILFVYERFEQVMKQGYIDEEDLLSILTEKLEKSQLFQNSILYLDEFSGFTPQEYEVLRKLIRQVKEMTITICSDQPKEVLNPDQTLFYANHQSIQRLKKLAKEENAIVEEIYLDTPKRFQNEELVWLEENLYEIHYQKRKQKPEKIHLSLADNPYSEIEWVAQNIVQKVKKEGYHYYDFAIMSKNISLYSSLAKAIFDAYDIPLFVDEKKDLSQNSLAQYVLSIFTIFTRNWSYEAVFEYLKTGFSPIEKEEQFELENYCIKWGIKGKKWYQEQWDYGAIIEDQKKQVERFNQLRWQIVTPLLELKDAIGSDKTVKELAIHLYEFLIKQEIDRKWQEKMEELKQIGQLEIANQYETSWKGLIQVLEEMVAIFQEKKVTFDQFVALLKIGLKKSGLGKIPATQDQVVLGDIERSRNHKVQVIYMIGLNDGVFPSLQTEEGFLNDEDRIKLKQKGMELAKTSLDLIYEDNFNIYKAFTTAEQEIYLSYPTSDQEGKSLRGSILLSKVKKIFPLLEQTSQREEKKKGLTKKTTFDVLVEQLGKVRQGEKIEPIWFDLYTYYSKDSDFQHRLEQTVQALWFSNMPPALSEEKMEKLYGNTLKTSVSQLEKYESCPFSYYLQYGLRIQKQPTFQIRSFDTGSFMHEVIDLFFSKVKNNQLKPSQLEENEIQQIVDQLVEEKLQLPKNYIFTSTPKFRLLTKRLKRVLVQSLKYILLELQNTDFQVVGNEVEFKKGQQYEPIIMELEDGKKVEITGKIDRIDIAKDQKESYLRIIDYKSSIKSMDLNEVIAGIQLQLLTYLDATCKIEEMIPAGVLYFSLLDPIISSNHRLSEQEIETELKKKFKMNGLILANVNVIKKMDATLEKGASTTLPVYLDKEGKISQLKSNVVTKEQFEMLQNYVKQTIQEIAKEIFEGKIQVKPYYSMKKKKSPCQYCDYQTICQFQKGFCQNDYRYIDSLPKEQVLEKIKKQEEEKSDTKQFAKGR